MLPKQYLLIFLILSSFVLTTACTSTEEPDGDSNNEDGDAETVDSDMDLADGDTIEIEDTEESEDVVSNVVPVPDIVIPQDMETPEPLDIIHLDARGSTTSMGDDRKPFEYWWDWAPDGKPAGAVDSILIASTGQFDDPVSIMGKWTNEGYPKIYLPVAGDYKIRVKVRDSAGVESDEWYTQHVMVKPTQKLHIELTWNKGENVDMDLFLVRYRTDGTFAMYAPAGDKNMVMPMSTAMPECGNDADPNDDCFDGAFACGADNVCVNSCTSDADCTKVDPGWYCKTDHVVNHCVAKQYIACNLDSDCPDNTFCSLVKIGLDSSKTICTHYTADAFNDTCSYIFKNPRWGDYSQLSDEDPERQCTTDADCNGPGSTEFICDSGICDFSCTTSSQCLSRSEQYLCSDVAEECIANNTDDDPTLDIDDVNGWGPENISVKNPVSGIYRIVARLYADPENILADHPTSAATATVQIYVNGERALPEGISHAIHKSLTHWKVADIYWDANLGEVGDATIEPICAGWTQNTCTNDNKCNTIFSDQYTCSEKLWDTKFCTNCATNEGTPEDCRATIACTDDGDCAGEAGKFCTTLKEKYCHCAGSNELADFSVDPYANPFAGVVTQAFDPTIEIYQARSIWCDNAMQTSRDVPNTATLNSSSSTFESVDIFSDGISCHLFY